MLQKTAGCGILLPKSVRNLDLTVSPVLTSNCVGEVQGLKSESLVACDVARRDEKEHTGEVS